MNEMLWFFFDTSAIVKRFHEEKGTEIVDKIIDSISEGRHRGIISALVILEFISACRRRVSSGDIIWREFIDGVMSFLKEATENFSMQAIDSSTYVDALDYIIKYGLSASDSVQLACINKITQTVEKSRLVLVCADIRLYESAEQEGFRALNPEHVTITRIDDVLKE